MFIAESLLVIGAPAERDVLFCVWLHSAPDGAGVNQTLAARNILLLRSKGLLARYLNKRRQNNEKDSCM